MTNEERHATVLWISESGYDELKATLLQETLARFRHILADANPVTQTLIGEAANTAILTCFNYKRLQSQKPVVAVGRGVYERLKEL